MSLGWASICSQVSGHHTVVPLRISTRTLQTSHSESPTHCFVPPLPSQLFESGLLVPKKCLRTQDRSSLSTSCMNSAHFLGVSTSVIIIHSENANHLLTLSSSFPIFPKWFRKTELTDNEWAGVWARGYTSLIHQWQNTPREGTNSGDNNKNQYLPSHEKNRGLSLKTFWLL